MDDEILKEGAGEGYKGKLVSGCVKGRVRV